MLKFTVLLLCGALMISAVIAAGINETSNNLKLPAASIGENLKNATIPSIITPTEPTSKVSTVPSEQINVVPNKKEQKAAALVTSSSTSSQSTALASPVTLAPTATPASTTISPMMISRKKTTTPKTTTEPTTTTTEQTTTTTTTTTTTKPPTTTSSPTTSTTSAPPKSSGRWIVKELDKICIIIQMAVQFNVTYITNNKTETYVELNMPLDNRTVATGVCGTTEQNITLAWQTEDIFNNTMVLHFVQNATTKHYSLDHLDVSLAHDNFPNISSNGTLELVHNPRHHFNTELSNSYRCLRLETLNLTTNTNNETVAFLKVSELQFQAFRNDNSTTFGLAEDCAFDVPDIVPIAVGCALAALVVIVLIAYLVGRRRRQAHGYLSM